MSPGGLVTPFRLHYEHCRALDVEGQLHECADHLQHPDVLLFEFFESYHLVERSWSPDQKLRPEATDDDELVLEPFYESLELSIRGAAGESERLVCVSGSMSPVPEEHHPPWRGFLAQVGKDPRRAPPEDGRRDL